MFCRWEKNVFYPKFCIYLYILPMKLDEKFQIVYIFTYFLSSWISNSEISRLKNCFIFTIYFSYHTSKNENCGTVSRRKFKLSIILPVINTVNILIIFFNLFPGIHKNTLNWNSSSTTEVVLVLLNILWKQV